MALSTLTFTYLTYTIASPTVIAATTVAIPIPAGLTTLDGGQNASTQTGFSSTDTLFTAITRRKGISFTDASGVLTFVPIGQIVKITAS
jgi:hypothetical protein